MLHKDCIPLHKFKRKIYTIKPYTDDPDREFTDKEKKRARNIIFKYDIDRCCCFFDKNNNIKMSYCYKSNTTNNGNTSTTTQKILVKLDKDLEKDKEYYTSCFFQYFGMYTKDLYHWAKKVNKEAEENLPK